MKNLFAVFICSLLLSGCNQSSDAVKILTGGIFAPTLFTLNDQDIDKKTLDLGEHLLTDAPRSLVIKVHNSTSYNYTNLNLTISADGENVPATTFAPTTEGSISYPGANGTCGTTLAPNTTCTINLLFSPRDGRRYLETFTLEFRNLVEAEIHEGKITVISGMPASIAFTNDTTQYTFGELIGATVQVPVVEREDAVTYEQELEVINAGGLPAKNVLVSLSQTCVSTLTSACPTGMGGAYTIDNLCPAVLMPGEKCKVKVLYSPKNQDPTSGAAPADIKEINYRSTLTFTYIKDPSNGTASLNSYFRSVSTNIEARFKTTLTTLSYETPIVVGNRDSRSFRINNLGFRAGEIKSIAVRGSGGSLIASCSAHATSDYLICKDASDAVISLATFPFSIKDRNGCLTQAAESPVLIAVGGGCIFDLYFQPSVTYLTDRNTEFQNLQPEVVFDSKWRGNVRIVTTKLFDLSSRSRAAARIELVDVQFNGQAYPRTGTGPWEVDLGRLTLQSPLFFKRKSLVITFRNNGSVPATNIGLNDAFGRTIPIGGTGANLGAKSPYYYSGAIASESNCTVIAPAESCSITIMFAPIGMDTNAEENANMFDSSYLLGGVPVWYKGFRLTYQNGSIYSDSNRESEVSDLSAITAEARIKATNIRKGMLMEFSDDTRNVSNLGQNVNTPGDTYISYIYIQNIGTGVVPYFRLLNPPVPTNVGTGANVNRHMTIIATTDPASLGADYDCLALGDEDTTYTIAANEIPANRLGNFSGLPKDKSCVYTVQMKTSNRELHFNSDTCVNTLPTLTNQEEALRIFNRSLQTAGGTSLYEYCDNFMNIAWNNIAVDYYDGDATDPALPVGSTYGTRKSLATSNLVAVQTKAAKLFPHSFTPSLTATLYRPGFDYPALATGQTLRSIAETWFYGLNQDFNYLYTDPFLTSPFVRGNESRDFVQTLSAYTNRANYDYILYLGSFPQLSPTLDFPINIQNFGTLPARILSLTATPDASGAFQVINLPTLPTNIATLQNIPTLNFRLSPSAATGEHTMVLDYEYENGAHINPLIYRSSNVASNLATAGKKTMTQKILVVAYIQPTANHPELTLDAQDYEVIQNDGAPPTVSIGSSYNVPLTWNTTAATATLVYDTIKLTATPNANDVYAKKKLTITNNTGFPITDLRILFRVDSSASAARTPPSSFTTVGGAGNTTCVSGATLGIGQNCIITFRYQPTSADVTEAFNMTMVYRMATGQHVMQNSAVSLLPRSPGQLVALSKATEPINYKVSAGSSSVTRDSYPLNFGTLILNTVPRTLLFDASSSTYQKLTFQNTQQTKTSLLLSYQKYLAQNSLKGYSPILPAPTSAIPAAGEYRTFSGEEYAIIHQAFYTNGNERMRLEASKGCLFGDDENDAGIPAHKKGFNSSSARPCFVIVTFNLNFEYLNKVLNIANGDDMRGTAVELWYYSVNRSSTASAWIHLKGTILPDTTTASGIYDNIQSFENRTISLSTPKLTANNASLGNVTGLRVLRSTSATALNDPYSTALTSYFDIRPYNQSITQMANFAAGMANGQYYYFRVVAIRSDPRFVDSTPPRFVGLNTNEYLSAPSNSSIVAKILVPPVNHYYFHNQKLLVDKALTGGVAYDPFNTAAAKCVNRTQVSLKDPSTVLRSYKLINLSTWTLLLNTPAATNYSAMTRISHWVGDATVSIDTKCSSLPGFVSNTNSQLLDAGFAFYIRNSSNPLAFVNQAVGGVPGSPADNYSSYVHGVTAFASSRCMVELP